MMLEAYEQSIENTVSPSIVSCDVQGVEGALSREDVMNRPRNVAVFLVRLLRGEKVIGTGRQKAYANTAQQAAP